MRESSSHYPEINFAQEFGINLRADGTFTSSYVTAIIM
jgi:hypothetical protein